MHGVIVAGQSHPVLAHALAESLDLPVIQAQKVVFPDGELKTRVESEVEGKWVVLVQSTSPPVNDHLMELLFLSEIVRRKGARQIIAVMPYFGYGRQDRSLCQRESISARLVASLIQAAGIDHVITVDLHTPQSEGFFKSVHNLDAMEAFKEAIATFDPQVIVSPDIGSLWRAKRLAHSLQCEVALVDKRRDKGAQGLLCGHVAHKRCLVVDDIVDTGQTVRTAFDLLIQQGACHIRACITHGVFSCPVSLDEDIHITDSIAQPLLPRVKQVSLTSLLAKTLSRFL